MAEHKCGHPGCFENEETCTMFREPMRRGSGSSTVCGKHADFDRDGIEVIEVNDAASAASAEILAGAQN